MLGRIKAGAPDIFRLLFFIVIGFLWNGYLRSPNPTAKQMVTLFLFNLVWCADIVGVAVKEAAKTYRPAVNIVNNTDSKLATDEDVRRLIEERLRAQP